MIKAELPEAHWNMVLEALAAGPYAVVQPVIDSLKIQFKTNGIQHGDNNGGGSEDVSAGG